MSKTKESQKIISVRNLSKSFADKKAVVNLSLQIQPGIIFGFLGPNGSGKTTTLRMLCGLILPDKGSGNCLGLDLLKDTKKIQAQIGYMPQSFCLYQHLTIYENLDFIARIYGLQDRKKKIESTMALFALHQRRNQVANTLSGGWQQRVALAAALLHEPKILLLDEPTSGIDPISRLTIWDHIQNLVNTGVTVLLSTHHLDEAERCHQLAFMSSGKLLTNGTVDEVIDTANLYTWQVKGPRLTILKGKLLQHSQELQIIEKGFEIRISSLNRDIMQGIDKQLFTDYNLQQIDTTLEDVFTFKLNGNK